MAHPNPLGVMLPRVLGVVGAGQMGSGIAQVAASSGLDVVLYDPAVSALERAQVAIRTSLQRLVKKEKLAASEAEEAVKRIVQTGDIEGVRTADFVVEAVNENEALKKSIFARLDQVCKPECVLATNTSSISITRIAAATSRPEQVVGMHFMNPVPVMRLVELVRGIATRDEVFRTAAGLAERLGKTSCVSLDRPGFIVNRILMPMLNEAFFALLEGVGTAEDIDKGMTLGTAHPMGPLQLADFIGLDTCLSIMRVLFDGTGDPKYRPCPLLVTYVDAGWLGKKTYRGVYMYAKPVN